MSEVTANWIFVGDNTFQRTEVYGETWASNLSVLSSDNLHPGPFGGPLLVVPNNLADPQIQICACSGQLISSWRWKSSRIVTCDWSSDEEAVFVTEDGNVLLHDLFGELLKTFTMGQEAKDLKVLDARVFRGPKSTGVVALTSAKRFFLVNNIQEPRVRKLVDVDLDTDGIPVWAVLSNDLQARVLVATRRKQNPLLVVSQSEASAFTLSEQGTNHDGTISMIVPSYDGELVAILMDNGKLWVGQTDQQQQLLCINITGPVRSSMLKWCGTEALLAFPYATESPLCRLINMHGHMEDTFLPEFVTASQEVDGTRVFTLKGQEFFQLVPRCLLATFDLRLSNSSSAELRYAAEEFYHNKSHTADDYMRKIGREVDVAVADCIESAGYVWNPLVQKELLRAAQLGKTFWNDSTSGQADAFPQMCNTLRILNSLRDFRIGIPLTIEEFRVLGSRVVIDRLLARRLFPLALKTAQVLKLPPADGESRVLSFWACYKVSRSSSAEDDVLTARIINQRLGHQPTLSYTQIASRAADSGKKELAAKLLEHEVQTGKQVPLLLKLGQEKSALVKALNSGNRDLAFAVILHLRSELSSTDFHFMIRKYPLGKVLYERFCGENGDDDALEAWYVQEDDYSALAALKFQQSYQTTSFETRATNLINVQEYLQKAKDEAFHSLTEETLKLIRHQRALESKLGASMLGQTVNETVMELLSRDEHKQAEKLKTEFKMSDRRFAFLRVKSLVRKRRWEDLKKWLKQQKKKLPLSITQIVHLVKDMVGDEEAKAFLNDEFVTSHTERMDLYTEFGMFVEAANSAFLAKSIDSLTALEGMSGGREDVLRLVSNFKAKLLSK